MQCEDTQDYRFRYEGAQVVCNLKLLFNEASGLIMERSEAACNTNAGKVIRPTGAQPVNITMHSGRRGVIARNTRVPTFFLPLSPVNVLTNID